MNISELITMSVLTNRKVETLDVVRVKTSNGTITTCLTDIYVDNHFSIVRLLYTLKIEHGKESTKLLHASLVHQNLAWENNEEMEQSYVPNVTLSRAIKEITE